MSFDIYLEKKCTHCGAERQFHWYNITHNTNGIVEACLGDSLGGTRGEYRLDEATQQWVEGPPGGPERGYNSRAWGRLHGHTALETRPVLEAALAKVKAWSPEFQAQLPDNGWGSQHSVTEAIEKAYLAARDAPDDAVWRANG